MVRGGGVAVGSRGLNLGIAFHTFGIVFVGIWPCSMQQIFQLWPTPCMVRRSIHRAIFDAGMTWKKKRRNSKTMGQSSTARRTLTGAENSCEQIFSTVYEEAIVYHQAREAEQKNIKKLLLDRCE